MLKVLIGSSGRAGSAVFIARSPGIKRAETKVTLANLAYNMNRLIFHEQRVAMG